VFTFGVQVLRAKFSFKVNRSKVKFNRPHNVKVIKHHKDQMQNTPCTEQWIGTILKTQTWHHSAFDTGRIHCRYWSQWNTVSVPRISSVYSAILYNTGMWQTDTGPQPMLYYAWALWGKNTAPDTHWIITTLYPGRPGWAGTRKTPTYTLSLWLLYNTLINFLHFLQSIASSLHSCWVWLSFSITLLQVCFGLYRGLTTFHFISMHFFTKSFFNMPIPS